MTGDVKRLNCITYRDCNKAPSKLDPSNSTAPSKFKRLHFCGNVSSKTESYVT